MTITATEAGTDVVQEPLPAERLAKLAAREAQLLRAREQAEVRRCEVSRQIAASILASPVQALPSLDGLVTRARTALNERDGGLAGESAERAIFTYLLETVTDYPQLARLLNRLDAGFELAAAVRIYVYCRVIRQYQLALDPLEVAFPSGARGTLPAAFTAGEPEAVAAAMLGVDA